MTREKEAVNTNVMVRASEQEPRRTWRTWLIGRPLATADAPHQTIGKAVGLAVFASDALSSTAYATQEIMFILAAVGTMAFGYVFPISIAIVLLMAIVTLSYQQTIHAYPGGGGAYIVARDNLGDLAAQMAGAALLTDYILTVAVSVSSGVAQIVSAYPVLYDLRVWIAVTLVAFITLLNLRGVKESGTVIAIPSFLFIVVMLVTIGRGFFMYFNGSLGVVSNPPEMEVGHLVGAITPFLILHAFSSGTAALTGIEAISNGVMAFKEPRSRNAAITLIWMAVLLAVMFLGISFLVEPIQALPSERETVISQLSRTVFEQGSFFYLAVIASTTVILILAANTSFAGFPRLSALLAADGFLPRQFAFRGSRLVYSRGIVALAALACILIAIFQASVTALIPLYAIGVFLSFTLSQFGMALRWRKIGRLRPGDEVKERGSILQHDRSWALKLASNSFGAVCTAVVMLVFAITKFKDGAFVVLIVIPLLVAFFRAVYHHYRSLAGALSLDDYGEPLRVGRHRVIMPVSGVHRGSLAALHYAQALSDDVTVVHVSVDPEETEKLREKWEHWGNGIRLVVLESPFRLFLEPLLAYVEEISANRQPGEIITIVVPQFVPRNWYSNLLHMQTAWYLRLALLFKPGVVVTDVPYQVR